MDNILFVVEGAKTEEMYVKLIFDFCYSNQYVCNDQNPVGSENIRLHFKWIENADIEKFVRTLEDDPLGYGIEADKYFTTDDRYGAYAETFIIIDADLKDKTKNKGDNSKVTLIKRLNDHIATMDNTELIISSPQIECIADSADNYKYQSGVKYKERIAAMFASGATGELKTKTGSILEMNIRKFFNDGVEYDQQSMDAILNYNVDQRIIKVRSSLFHVIANKANVYTEAELLNFIAYCGS